ncbi:SMC-Scp complex subunit ScpB [Prosthecochloris sp. N3]|uniref:SMC-Scp complex subunit ScpB n=1 Tax=Prosthecochloris ethylica TaxID=2743976 RepID=A0ABR9XQK0_9CHLB|nr:SMC-Scp complex subunit ScpB [Prosthecochloris ethylica]MBF0636167.1 SMC-Scp complex subunit ScpB [Prosthecochloris ethylica]NUK47696.1 SMC-Scp complex subunit ScpB [Prosthecochloris ethylica]
MPHQEPSLHQQVEALVFASEEAVSADDIVRMLGTDLTVRQIDRLVDELNHSYDTTGRSFRIVRIAGGFRFLTIPALAPLLRKLQAPTVRRKLSQSVLEVLAVIAYRQPVSRSEIQQVRGVSPDYAINKLLERGLIDVRGRARTVGKPLLYGTTKEFLDLFQLPSLQDLPKLREIKELVHDREVREYLSSAASVQETVKSDDDESTEER